MITILSSRAGSNHITHTEFWAPCSDIHYIGRHSVRQQDSSYLNSILAFNKDVVIQQCSAVVITQRTWAYDQAGGHPANFVYKNGPAGSHDVRHH